MSVSTPIFAFASILSGHPPSFVSLPSETCPTHPPTSNSSKPRLYESSLNSSRSAYRYLFDLRFLFHSPLFKTMARLTVASGLKQNPNGTPKAGSNADGSTASTTGGLTLPPGLSNVNIGQLLELARKGQLNPAQMEQVGFLTSPISTFLS